MWTGHYLRGQNTYIELFGPGGFPGARPGMTGIGFGVEESGGVTALSAAFSGRGIAFDTSTRVRLVDGSEIPWFFVGALAASDSVMPTFSTWVMEYHPVWAARQAATDSATPSDITRRRRSDSGHSPVGAVQARRRVGGLRIRRNPAPGSRSCAWDPVRPHHRARYAQSPRAPRPTASLESGEGWPAGVPAWLPVPAAL